MITAVTNPAVYETAQAITTLKGLRWATELGWDDLSTADQDQIRATMDGVHLSYSPYPVEKIRWQSVILPPTSQPPTFKSIPRRDLANLLGLVGIEDMAVRHTDLYTGPPIIVPSCGDGAILETFSEILPTADIKGVDSDITNVLRAQVKGLDVIYGPTGAFLREQDDPHIVLLLPAAWAWARGDYWLHQLIMTMNELEPNGRLIAVVPREGFYSQERAFLRNLLAEHRAYWCTLDRIPGLPFTPLLIDYVMVGADRLAEWRDRSGGISDYASDIIIALDNDGYFYDLDLPSKLLNLDGIIAELIYQEEARFLWTSAIREEIIEYLIDQEYEKNQ